MKRHVFIIQTKGRKIIIKSAISIVAVVILLTFLLIFQAAERPIKPFFEGEHPLVIAHRGGAALAPENTLKAFENAIELGVDVIEFDIQMTKDGHLVAIHDETVDRTTDGVGKVNEMTLAEAKQLDAGYSFLDENGEHPYRAQDITIPTVEEIFSKFPNIKMNIEIKDYGTEDNLDVLSQKLWELISNYQLKDNVLIASFNDNVIKYFQELSNNQVAVSAGQKEVIKFVLMHYFFLSRFYSPLMDVIQLPQEVYNIPLTNERLIANANRLGLDVHYWTINDREQMKSLVRKGANGIITDYPDILLEILNEEAR